MTQAYSDPTRESDPHAFPDVEVFQLSEREVYDIACANADSDVMPFRLWAEDYRKFASANWYYWYCFPGCLPDSEPVGPFDSEAEAIAAAQEDCQS